MSKPVEFDELFDVAFAEMYAVACRHEHNGNICSEGEPIEDFVRTVKQMAADYVEAYEAACEIGEPDFTNGMYEYADRKLKEKYPPLKEFTVLIDANMTYEYKTEASCREEAEKEARNMMELDPAFCNRFRNDARVYDMQIGDVIEK